MSSSDVKMTLLIVILALLPLVHSGYNKNYYMPGMNCNTVRVREIDGAVIRSSPNKMWSHSACLMKFEADDDLFTSKRLMINVEELNIQNCEVSLKVYFARTSDGKTPDYTFTCRSSKPKLIITNGKYATFRLDTRTDKGYSFKIIVTSFKETSFCKEMMCANRKCIERKLRCDGINHCGDNSDETNCAGVRRLSRFGMGSTLASAFSTLVVVMICVALCVVCVRRRRNASQGEVLQQQQLMVRTGIEPGPPPPGMVPPNQGQYQQVPGGYQVPSYNPGAYPPPGPMPPGAGQPPPPYGYPPQPYYPPPSGPAPAYPPQGDAGAMYPPPGPPGPPMGPPPPAGQYPVSYNVNMDQVKMPGNQL